MFQSLPSFFGIAKNLFTAGRIPIGEEVKRLERLTSSRGIKLALSIHREDLHHYIYKELEEYADRSGPLSELQLISIDAHSDCDVYGGKLHCGNWVTRVTSDFPKRGIIPRLGLLSAEAIDSKHAHVFPLGIFSEPLRWPKNWCGIVSFDLDYSVGWNESTAMRSQIKDRIEGVVDAWISNRVRIELLHIDRGYIGEAEVPFALKCFNDAFERY